MTLSSSFCSSFFCSTGRLYTDDDDEFFSIHMNYIMKINTEYLVLSAQNTKQANILAISGYYIRKCIKTE